MKKNLSSAMQMNEEGMFYVLDASGTTRYFRWEWIDEIQIIVKWFFFKRLCITRKHYTYKEKLLLSMGKDFDVIILKNVRKDILLEIEKYYQKGILQKNYSRLVLK